MNPLARFSFPKLPAAPKGGTIPLKGANRTMDKILNLLSLTPGEKEAFLAAAPGLSQRFAAIALGNLGRYLRGKPLRNQVR